MELDMGWIICIIDLETNKFIQKTFICIGSHTYHSYIASLSNLQTATLFRTLAYLIYFSIY